jgi:CMP-N,N'-diacetyllegionaminic acid synthase
LVKIIKASGENGMQKILAIVLARGGSKRIPGKNLIPLGEKPLISWTIDFARRIEHIHDVLVSTDSAAIADVARERGGLVPWLRPQTLSGDDAKSEPGILHALNWFESQHHSVTGVMLLQPTSPFRKEETIRRALELFENNPNSAVITVARSQPNLMEQESEEFHFSSEKPSLNVRPNGNLYLFSPQYIRENQSVLKGHVISLPSISFVEDIDIDTPEDLEVARMIQRQYPDLD